MAWKFDNTAFFATNPKLLWMKHCTSNYLLSVVYQSPDTVERFASNEIFTEDEHKLQVMLRFSIRLWLPTNQLGQHECEQNLPQTRSAPHKPALD